MSRALSRDANRVDGLPAADVMDRPGGAKAKAALTTSEMARMVGMSATFIRNEIRAGHITAARMGRGRKCVFRIPHAEALRYARRAGLY